MSTPLPHTIRVATWRELGTVDLAGVDLVWSGTGSVWPLTFVLVENAHGSTRIDDGRDKA